MNDISLLKKLLNKRSEDEVIEDAVTYYVDNALQANVRDAYKTVIAITTTNQKPVGGDSVPGFAIAREAKGMRFNPDKTRGKIALGLMARERFTRVDFRSTVAEAMGWNPAAEKFSISTKFRTLEEAERAWWNTLKGRDKLIVPVG